MRETDIEVILERAKEKYPEAKPRIISDNGPQFIARDFKEFIRISGMTHVRTSPYYPQSNGKIERWHKSLKSECIRPGTPLSLDDARLVLQYVEHYNNTRLNSAIGYVTPKDMLAGRQQEIPSPHGTASLKRRASSGNCAASRRHEERVDWPGRELSRAGTSKIPTAWWTTSSSGKPRRALSDIADPCSCGLPRTRWALAPGPRSFVRLALGAGRRLMFRSLK